MITDYLNLLRVKDWIKNLLILLPLIFSEQIFISNHYSIYFLIIFFFSLLTSIVYIINDIRDLKKDSLDKRKLKIKPIANKKISNFKAFIIMLFLTTVVSIFLIFNIKFVSYFVIYLILNILYSFYLKRFPFIDIIIVAIGYNIRVELGSEAIDVNTTLLMQLSIFFLAIFILANKRKVETNNLANISKKYNINTLNYLSYFSIITAISFYIFYIFQKNIYLIITIPLVIFISYRFIYLNNNSKYAGFPTDIFIKDHFLLFGVFFYFVIIVLLLY